MQEAGEALSSVPMVQKGTNALSCTFHVFSYGYSWPKTLSEVS
jgi:hypothetical protein